MICQMIWNLSCNSLMTGLSLDLRATSLYFILVDIFKIISSSGKLLDSVKCDVEVLFRNQLVSGMIGWWLVFLMLVVVTVSRLLVDCWLSSEVISK